MIEALNMLGHGSAFSADKFGNEMFRRDYRVKYAYVAGAMYKGIASVEMVVAMAKAGLMSFFGAGGLSDTVLEQAITSIHAALTESETFGVNLLPDYATPEKEMKRVDILLRNNVRYVEAAAYMELTPAIVRYRLQGLHRNARGEVQCGNTVMAKVSHSEVAEMFMRPAPSRMVDKLLSQGLITVEQAELAQHIPLAQDICVEADSGGHTDRGNASVLLPAIMHLREQVQIRQQYVQPIRVGLAGGIGTPEAVMTAFFMGADFITTGSINQCSIEAATSPAVKDLLQNININDTDYAPAGDMFETGATVQVMKKGVFFPARANKLYRLYNQYQSLDDMPEDVIRQLETSLFKCSIDEIWQQTRTHMQKSRPAQLAFMETNPRKKMAAVFRWYFIHTTRLALRGDEHNKVDYQIHCGPALGALNQLLLGTAQEHWQNRSVVWLCEYLMSHAARLLSERFRQFFSDH
ncbi:PfaD family polyunsaturated fatty acid/polyketide biosynthesis protein [Gynuella sunshinyii]|uniref:Dioxygenases-like 2-nitropropane dioxygenase n=1 Tax=Gynuella sunshinyii YC6258 TaxID=1445510 RepID=A0A0C5VVX5_9GAMM|nr:PfaD family polyunsaturated fatty acid/polyketide biosynthesis protein [Gynuella sunshinyii]AJQ97473.1 dioxygenases-like 2-nitropropane dioxygenase [Gynuella sunshinyii YC6258]